MLGNAITLSNLPGARVEVLKKVRLTSEAFALRWSSFCEWASQPRKYLYKTSAHHDCFLTEPGHIDIRNRIILGAGVLTFALIFFGIPALGFTASGINAGKPLHL